MPEDLKQVVDKLLSVGAAQGVVKVDTGGVPAALVPAGYALQSLEQYLYNTHREFPERKTGSVVVDEPKSFLTYWTLFHDEDSQAFADPNENKITAVLDYHGAGSEKQPRWKQHQCTLQLQTTDEWDEWTAENRKPKGQSEFAEFLEDHAPDIVALEVKDAKSGKVVSTVDGAGFVELARDLKAKTDVQFDSKIVQESGSVRFGYVETVQGGMGAKGEFTIPEKFTIQIPVYLGAAKVKLDVRLRYRINSGKLTMWYDLYRASYKQREAFEEVIATVEQGIGKKVFIGSV